jgi:hypothetical protein
VAAGLEWVCKNNLPFPGATSWDNVIGSTNFPFFLTNFQRTTVRIVKANTPEIDSIPQRLHAKAKGYKIEDKLPNGFEIPENEKESEFDTQSGHVVHT